MKRMMAISALALLLAACGGSGSDNGSSSGGAPVAMADAFFAMVSSLIATSPDNTEPVAIDNTTVTTPEDSEPAAV